MTNDYRSIRFHLAYPKQATIFTWSECACLARCLGYRDTSIEQCYRQAVEAKHQGEGFQLSQLDAFLDSKFFKSGFDFAFNSHSCEWNEQAIRRAFAVTAGKGMTFQQLYTTRIAYSLYESSDLKGLKAKPRTVMRALKACGRAISLGKMAHRVRHMHFHEPGRLQLDEFIDLALWARPLAREEKRCAIRPATAPNQMVSFEDLLTPLDRRVQRRLDAEYKREERQYTREKVRHEEDETRLRASSVLGYRQARLARSRQVRSAYEPLRQALRESSASVRSRKSCTADDSVDRAVVIQRREGRGFESSGEEEKSPDEAGLTNTDEEEDRVKYDANSQAKRQQKRLRKRPSTAAASFLSTSRSTMTSRSQPPLVTPEEVSRMQLQRSALAFQMRALPEFHARWIAEDMQTLRPGFQRRHAARQVEAAATAAVEEAAAAEMRKQAEKEAAAIEKRNLRLQRQERVAELAKRGQPTPLPSHGRVCDALTIAASDTSTTTTTTRTESARKTRIVLEKSPTTAKAAATTMKPLKTDEQKQEDPGWVEPVLGLSLPLTEYPSTHRRISRIGYSRSCPPSKNCPTFCLPDSIDSGATKADAATVDLIQRLVYAT